MSRVTTTVTTSVVTTEPEAPRVPLTLEEQQALILRWNATRPKPSPVCRLCDHVYQRGDADPFDKTVCCTCGANRLEERVRELLRAKGKKARKRALRRLFAIAK